MPLKSHRFWMLVVGGLVAIAAIVGVVVKPEAATQIVAAAIGLKGLLAVGVHSDGNRRMSE